MAFLLHNHTKAHVFLYFLFSSIDFNFIGRTLGHGLWICRRNSFNWSTLLGTSTCASLWPLITLCTILTVASGHRCRSTSATLKGMPESVLTLSSVESSCSHRAMLLIRALASTACAVLSTPLLIRSASVGVDLDVATSVSTGGSIGAHIAAA